jgi:hypothetical protein
LRWKSPKVSGLVREYSRFAETIGGDNFHHDCRTRATVDLAYHYRQLTLSNVSDLPVATEAATSGVVEEDPSGGIVSDKILLAFRSGGICAFPGCAKPLVCTASVC